MINQNKDLTNKFVICVIKIKDTDEKFFIKRYVFKYKDGINYSVDFRGNIIKIFFIKGDELIL